MLVVRGKKVVEVKDVLCMRFDPSTEGEGSDRTFCLPGGQDSFIEQVAGLNKNVIVVLTAGGNLARKLPKYTSKIPIPVFRPVKELRASPK